MGIFGKKKIQSTEGKKDILNVTLQQYLSYSNNKEVRKNQYTTYGGQVEAIYDKYQCSADYGSSLVPTVIDIRTSLIAGEGLTSYAENKDTKKWVDKFISDNRLNGSGIIDIVRNSELEGITLLTIDIDSGKICLNIINKRNKKYIVNTDTKGKPNVVSMDYDSKHIEIKKDLFEIYKTSGLLNNYNETPPKISSVLTQIDNYERALYDLRNANHIFGFPTPCFETPDQQSTNAINNAINAMSWSVGKAFASQSKMYYPVPPNSYETIMKEMSLNLKLISSRMGIPVHWLGWTDLMSNRAVADELREFVNTSIKYEKLLLKETLTELIKKAMRLAYDNGLDEAVYDPEGFTIDIPDVTLAYIKELSETWLPLAEAEIISYSDVRNKIPGIDPKETEAKIEAEKKGEPEKEIGDYLNLEDVDDEEIVNNDVKQNNNSIIVKRK